MSPSPALVSAVPDDQRVRGGHQLVLLLREQGDGAAALGERQPAAESQRPDPRGKRTAEDNGETPRGGEGGEGGDMSRLCRNPLPP